jgi:hypothetical protein
VLPLHERIRLDNLSQAECRHGAAILVGLRRRRSLRRRVRADGTTAGATRISNDFLITNVRI